MKPVTVLLCSVMIAFSPPAYADKLTDAQKIDALLAALASPDITFIQNDDEHTGYWAKNDLSEKLKESGGKITTPNAFIADVASVSDHTGVPNEIRIKNGETMSASDWFHKQLFEIEKQEYSAMLPGR
jgi:hypothetical protein